MSTNLVIVAIPEEQDRVWKLSSEKVPHLTLLFLGEEEGADTQQIMQFVEHAVTLSEHGQFYLDVDRRGELGEDKADVIFFSKRSWNLKWIKQFRSQLLQNQAVRTAYDSTEQFDEWLPHLTLGYPETPAKEPEDGNDYPLYSVAFDRIAVWTGDYEGPEFRLEWPEREMEGDQAIAWNDSQKAAIKHHGVKGMKWGVRKEGVDKGGHIRIGKQSGSAAVSNRSQAALLLTGPFAAASPRFRAEFKAAGAHNKAQRAEKKAAKKDKKWEKNQFTLPQGVARHNAMAEHFNSRIGALNDKYAKDNFSKENPDTPATWTPRYKEYNKDVMGLQESSFRHAVETVHGTSPSGKKKMEVVGDIHNDTMRIEVKDVDKIAHAATGSEVFLFKITRNDNGIITNLDAIESEEDSMSQTAELGEGFLEHYGVRGMRWGHRKSEETGGSNGAGAASKPTAGAKAKSGLKALGRGVSAVAKVAGDVTFESMANDGRAREAIEVDATKALHRTDLPKIKAKPEYQKAKKLRNRLRHPRDPMTKQYRKEVKSTYINRLEEAANARTNASGTRQYTIRERGWELPAQGGNLPTSRSFWEVSTREVQHADAPTKPFFVELITDDDGFITELKPVESKSAEHSVTDLGEAFIIEHYGVKGMRWGFRRTTPTAVSPHATSRVPHGNRRKTKVEVEGGQNHPAHEDAIKVAEAKAKLKRSGTSALSNKELQDVANRVQLEERVKVLTSSKGKKFVKRELENRGENLAKAGVKKAAKAGAKKAATAVFV